jgi:hypothetical protein
VELAPRLRSNGYRQPAGAAGGFDPVAIPPPILVEGNVVVKDENVSLIDLVKVATPWDIGRL